MKKSTALALIREHAQKALRHDQPIPMDVVLMLNVIIDLTDTDTKGKK